MALFANLKRRFGAAPSQVKASAAPLGTPFGTAFFSMPGPRWGARGYEAMLRAAYEQNAVAQRSLRMIADGIGSIKWVLCRDRVKLERHPLLNLLARPNPREAGPDFLGAVASYLTLAGNAYIERVRGSDDLPVELYALRPERMRIISGNNGWPSAYEYKLAQHVHRFTVDPLTGESDILHLKSFHPLDDHYGLGALSAAARGVDIHNAADGWNKALIDNAARPSGALVFEPKDGQPGTLSHEQFERLKLEMEESFQGAKNAGRPLLLEGGLKWQQMALSPADMHHHDTKHAAARDIALAFGVPPMMLGIPGDNTYSNYQEANRALWRLTLLPLANKLCAALENWLTPHFEDGLTLDFDRDAIPALAVEREALWAQIGGASFLSDEEKRRLLGLGDCHEHDPAPGLTPVPDGDDHSS